MLTLLTSGSPLSTIEGNKIYYILFLAIPIFALILSHKREKFNGWVFVVFGLLLFACVASGMLNFQFQYLSVNLKLLGIITYSYCFTRSVKFSVFVIFLPKAVAVLTLLSLLVFGYLNIYGYLNLPSFTNINDVGYYNGVFITPIYKFGDYPLMTWQFRNNGAFWEPGLFASILSLSLITESVFNPRPRLWISFILILGLLSTLSGGGFLLLILYGLLILIKKPIKIRLGFAVLSVTAIVMIIILTSQDLYFMQISMIEKASDLGNISWIERLESPAVNLRIFRESPLFGKGIQ